MTTRKTFQEETMTPTAEESAEAVRDSYPERAAVMRANELLDKVYAVLAHRFPRCRDCADDGPTCPHSGLPCDLKSAFDTIRALPLLGVMRREDVARAVKRGRHIRCCTGAALDDVCALPLTQEDYDIADAVLALPHAGQPVEELRGDSKRGPSLEAFGDCAESAQYHDTERKKYQAAIAAPSATETAAVKNLVLASAALIADWSADCKVEDATIVKLLEAYNTIGSQRLLLSEVERELAPASPQPPVKP